MTSTILALRECTNCGKLFTAHTTFTKYCSKTCNNRDYKKRKRIEKLTDSDDQLIAKRSIQYRLLEMKPFLKISELSVLLGISRGSVYNLIQTGVLPVIKIGARTLIDRKSINEVFTSEHKNTPSIVQHDPIAEFYTTKDIEEQFGIKYGYLYQLLRKYNIPNVNRESRLIVSKPHFDSFINKRNKIVHSDGAFVKVRDLMAEYGLNRDQVYRRIKCYKIPSKKVGGIQFICKKSFDDVVKPLI